LEKDHAEMETDVTKTSIEETQTDAAARRAKGEFVRRRQRVSVCVG
jgi:hypothetical protein